MAKTPKLGGELPPYTTTGTPKPKKPRKAMATIVQRAISNRSTGTPGTSKFVQRSPRISTGTPGTSKFVQRMPGGAHQRKPSAAGVGLGRVMGTLRSVLTAPRKPAK
jgi:hypothetical protein